MLSSSTGCKILSNSFRRSRKSSTRRELSSRFRSSVLSEELVAQLNKQTNKKIKRITDCRGGIQGIQRYSSQTKPNFIDPIIYFTLSYLLQAHGGGHHKISLNIFSTALLLQHTTSPWLQHPGEEVTKNYLDSAIENNVASERTVAIYKSW